MEYTIREYKKDGDRSTFVACMEKLQDCIVEVDTEKRVMRRPEFGELYTNWVLDVVEKNQGVIYFAEKGDEIVGCIAGFIHTQGPVDVAQSVPSKAGRVQELYVDANYRGHGVGKMLMEKCEAYFRTNGCDVVAVEVFAPNKNAYAFYRACGYIDRDINLMKRL